jgi:hypothetical protein
MRSDSSEPHRPHSTHLNRRSVLKAIVVGAGSALAGPMRPALSESSESNGPIRLAALAQGGPVGAAAPETKGHFTLKKRAGRWWFISPAGEAVFSLGLNHIDSAPLRYTNAGHIWREKYANSTERWLKQAVAPDLRDWGFNGVGWTQEVVVRGPNLCRHSPPFTFEEYQWLGMPYCHLLPFAEIHEWENETRNPDFFSQDFEDWCDYVARTHCARMADDPKLIGYFYSDCPTWVHTRPGNKWKGPLFDPEKLKTDAGRKQLTDLATRYYRITHDAIRRYDANHLILGDRYEAAEPIPDELLDAAGPFVDVLCFQHFGQPAQVQADLARRHERTGKPVLLADFARAIKAPSGIARHDGAGYRDMLSRLRDIPGCVGFHLCGAYLRNHCRNRGLRDELEHPDQEAIDAISAANRQTTEWARNTSAKAD